MSLVAVFWFNRLPRAFALPPSPFGGDIVFVTQVPVVLDAGTVVSTFGNQRAKIQYAPRGGDLYIRYADGTLRNLTAAAGLGNDGLQGHGSIAVRDPAVHWSGNKVLFSMVVGAPLPGEPDDYRWQLYEMTGLGKNETPRVTKVPHQPEFNNVMPSYDSHDRILFVTDRPPQGREALAPLLDEGAGSASTSGVWSLDPNSGDLAQLDHAPSGAFRPFVDSFGRIIFTRWDHLERDLLSDDTDLNGGFDYAGELATSARLRSKTEFFPEPRSPSLRPPNLNLHTFDQFFPWQMNEDGTGLETVNHIGRHELHDRFTRSFIDDPNLVDFSVRGDAANQNRINNLIDIREDPANPGLLYAVDAPELGSHGAGQIVSLTGAPTVNPDQMIVRYVTHRDTHLVTSKPSVNHSGLYRDPVALTDGTVVVSHTAQTGPDANLGTSSSPRSSYDFRLSTLVAEGTTFVASDSLTNGINKSIAYYDPTTLISYSGPLWELQPVELVARNRPATHTTQLADPEKAIFAEAGVDPLDFQAFLRDRNLGLVVSRNVTTRDRIDRQQPFNLFVPGGLAVTVGAQGKRYEAAQFQIFQGDLIRAFGGPDHPVPGRRILAQPLHEETIVNASDAGGPPGSVMVAPDGSIAAIVPARRPLTWQVSDSHGIGVVRERYWLTLQPGEIRVCSSCHGVNTADQAGQGIATNPPEALRIALATWKSSPAPPPAFRLSLSRGKGDSATTIRGKTRDNGIVSATPISLDVQGQTATSASKKLLVRALIDGRRCPRPIGVLFTNGSGAASFQGKAPTIGTVRTRHIVPLRFDLYFADRRVASVSTRVEPRHPAGRRIRRITYKSILTACAALEAFRPGP